MTRRVAALIVAAGRGSRLGGDLPKQYAALGDGDGTVLAQAVDAFLGAPLVDVVQVVIHSDDLELYRRAIGERSVLPPVIGGTTRQESVLAGLEALSDDPPECVLVHDAARPFVTQATIANVIGALAFDDAAIAASPVVDTLKRSDSAGLIVGTQDRRDLWQAQTPQGFRFAPILTAHRQVAGKALTDDAAVAEAAGLAVRLIEDSRDNFKITTAGDLERARTVALPTRSAEVRCGHGFDTHRLEPAATDNKPLMLCGVAVASPLALVGHSDADVGLHALTDALLGALGDGDIGTHFPPSEPQWKGASSDRFVRFAVSRCRAAGYGIANVDVTLICEQPRIGPYRGPMRRAIATMLGVAEDQASVKATTTERLGAFGRGEGIGALATAMLVRCHDR